MPIYEFYCPPCHTIYNFFSPVVNTTASPSCPKCGHHPLEKRASRFATLKYKGEEEPNPFDQMDESTMERAVDTLVREMGDLEDSEDPKTAARFMKRFLELTGMQPGPKMEELLARMEAGEDMEALEEEMEDLDEDEEALMKEFFNVKQPSAIKKKLPPKKDETLYFL